MRFTLIKNLNKDKTMKPILVGLLSFTLLYLLIDIFVKKKSVNRKLKKMTKKEKEIILKNLEKQLKLAIDKWEFEKAAQIRDQIKKISNE